MSQNFNEMTRTQLKLLCIELGITGISKPKKKKLIDLLEQYYMDKACVDLIHQQESPFNIAQIVSKVTIQIIKPLELSFVKVQATHYSNDYNERIQHWFSTTNMCIFQKVLCDMDLSGTIHYDKYQNIFQYSYH
jgi:hypothetical protein